MKTIVLDSAPLGILTHRLGIPEADACRAWLDSKFAINDQIVIPEIIDYEVRRELLRARKSASIQRLDDLVHHPKTRFLPISSEALYRAAHLWAQVRQTGKPTADVHAIDIDVILAAQVLTAANLNLDVAVATSNVSHISLFLPAAPWRSM